MEVLYVWVVVEVVPEAMPAGTATWINEAVQARVANLQRLCCRLTEAVPAEKTPEAVPAGNPCRSLRRCQQGNGEPEAMPAVTPKWVSEAVPAGRLKFCRRA